MQWQITALSHLVLTGTTTTSSVTIQSASLSLDLSSVSITSPSPFTISASSVSVLVVGSNLLSSRPGDHSGRECSRWSNISLHGAPAGTFTGVQT
jgi:hypothetical protein